MDYGLLEPSLTPEILSYFFLAIVLLIGTFYFWNKGDDDDRPWYGLTISFLVHFKEWELPEKPYRGEGTVDNSRKTGRETCVFCEERDTAISFHEDPICLDCMEDLLP